MWLDFREFNMSQSELKSFLFEKAKLGLNDGATFGEEGKGFMRLNIACPKSTLVKALDNLKKAVDSL